MLTAVMYNLEHYIFENWDFRNNVQIKYTSNEKLTRPRNIGF